MVSLYTYAKVLIILQFHHHPMLNLHSSFYAERHYCVIATRLSYLYINIRYISSNYDHYSRYKFVDRRDETLHNYFHWLIDFYSNNFHEYRMRRQYYNIDIRSNFFQNYLRSPFESQLLDPRRNFIMF